MADRPITLTTNDALWLLRLVEGVLAVTTPATHWPEAAIQLRRQLTAAGVDGVPANAVGGVPLDVDAASAGCGRTITREALGRALFASCFPNGVWDRAHSYHETFCREGDAARAALGLPPAPDAAPEEAQP